jgi:hypothetical protein
LGKKKWKEKRKKDLIPPQLELITIHQESMQDGCYVDRK